MIPLNPSLTCMVKTAIMNNPVLCGGDYSFRWIVETIKDKIPSDLDEWQIAHLYAQIPRIKNKFLKGNPRYDYRNKNKVKISYDLP